MTARLLLLILVLPLSAFADEGMWLFNNPPLKQFKEKYQFEPPPQWLEHLQKSSVRFNSGGSGSFVSATGLVITNHHVGADTLQKISSEQHNYLRDGFYAQTPADEIKSTDLELNVLVSIEDVTQRVNGAVTPTMSAGAANKARENVIAQIEKESKEKTGLRSDVIALYQGGVTICIATNAMMMSASSSRPSSKSPFTAGIPIISSIRASTSIFASSAFTKMASRCNRSIISSGTRRGQVMAS